MLHYLKDSHPGLDLQSRHKLAGVQSVATTLCLVAGVWGGATSGLVVSRWHARETLPRSTAVWIVYFTLDASLHGYTRMTYTYILY